MFTAYYYIFRLFSVWFVIISNKNILFLNSFLVMYVAKTLWMELFGIWLGH